MQRYLINFFEKGYFSVKVLFVFVLLFCIQDKKEKEKKRV